MTYPSREVARTSAWRAGLHREAILNGHTWKNNKVNTPFPQEEAVAKNPARLLQVGGG